MEITRISVYQLDLPFDHGPYRLADGRTLGTMDSTVIRIDTDEGFVGWGETASFTPGYLGAFARGARAGVAELAPALLGQDPGQPAVIYALMDHHLLGHAYVKHGLDMACWDLLGKLTRQPLYLLFGGMLSDYPRVSGALPPLLGEPMQQALERLRAEHCAQFTALLSGEPGIDIEYMNGLGDELRAGETVRFDIHGGWRVDQALRVLSATAEVNALFEQPCASYEDCRALRQVSARPLVFDEIALDLETVIRGWRDGICDAVNLKIGRLGGLTPALRMRDLCQTLGLPFCVQCAGGSQITQAAIVHLAHSSVPDLLLNIRDLGDLVSTPTVTSPVPRKQGKMHAHLLPGLGVEPIAETLGEPVAVYA